MWFECVKVQGTSLALPLPRKELLVQGKCTVLCFSTCKQNDTTLEFQLDLQ